MLGILEECIMVNLQYAPFLIFWQWKILVGSEYIPNFGQEQT